MDRWIDACTDGFGLPLRPSGLVLRLERHDILEFEGFAVRPRKLQPTGPSECPSSQDILAVLAVVSSGHDEFSCVA